MLNFFRKLFSAEEKPPQEAVQEQDDIQSPKIEIPEEKVRFSDLIAEFYIPDESGYTLNIPSQWKLKNSLNNHASLFGDSLNENLSKLSEEETEQLYYLCLAGGKLLYDIESTYNIMVRAYKKLLKGVHKNWLNEGNGLFLFGFNNKFRIDTNQKYSQYKEYCFFLIANPHCRFEVVSYSRWLWSIGEKQPLYANEVCLVRISDMLRLTMKSVKQQEKYMMWQAYFIFLLTPSPISQDAIEYTKSIKSKSKQFKKQLERIELIAKEYKDTTDKHSWYWLTFDERVLRKQIDSEFRKEGIPLIIKPFGLFPTSFNWRFSVEFSTGDFSKCKNYYRKEMDGLTDRDAIIGLHISADEKWVADLQWYLPFEKNHYLRLPSHERPRIMWRNMYKHPISWQTSLKDKAPDFEDVYNFPQLVNELQIIFGLDFKRTANVSLKGLKIEDKGLIEKWLSPCADKIVFGKEPDRSDLN